MLAAAIVVAKVKVEVIVVLLVLIVVFEEVIFLLFRVGLRTVVSFSHISVELTKAMIKASCEVTLIKVYVILCSPIVNRTMFSLLFRFVLS